MPSFGDSGCFFFLEVSTLGLWWGFASSITHGQDVKVRGHLFPLVSWVRSRKMRPKKRETCHFLSYPSRVTIASLPLEVTRRHGRS